jgi:hypothetical protein
MRTTPALATAARPLGIDEQYPRPWNAAGSGPVVHQAVGVALGDAHVPAISHRRIPGSWAMRSGVPGVVGSRVPATYEQEF